jgi:uncharacterized protein (TIGR03083 family)
MDTRGFTAAIRSQSERLHAALQVADLGRAVPTCPDWNGHDLAWHLAEVQLFWGAVVRQLMQDPATEYDEPARPDDDDLLDLVRDAGDELVAALDQRSPDDRCWSWHPDGETVGWVARRQAHEALIHRVDAELVAGVEVTVPDMELAADGIDEVLGVMFGGLPPWATFAPDGEALTVVSADADRRWTVEFGRFTGESPTSGRTYDEDDARLVDLRPTGTTISGSAWDLDRWLWGRGDASALRIIGDGSLAERLRAVATESTQ